MKEQLLTSFENPAQLEKLYRSDKAGFKQAFGQVYPQLQNKPLALFWHERLHYAGEEIFWRFNREFLLVVVVALGAGILVKLPAILPISEEFYYPRNLSFFVFPPLTAYFSWKNNLPAKRSAILVGIAALCLVYINALPHHQSDTLLLACIHLPLVLWVLFGVSYAGSELHLADRGLGFLRFNGDLAVMSALLVIAGGMLTGITIGLFSIIGFRIEDFYFNFIVAFGLPAVPIVAAYLTQNNPQLVNKVSPVIARLFSPLVLVMLALYLVAILYAGKDPYNDREFLLLFNILLIGVMALIFFSVAESANRSRAVAGLWVLLLLSAVTVAVNGIALSAISFRMSAWGITPNRVAVMGGNVLMLVHLLLVTVMLFKAATHKAAIAAVGRSIVLYLPVYFVWALVVVFLFPLLFGFA